MVPGNNAGSNNREPGDQRAETGNLQEADILDFVNDCICRVPYYRDLRKGEPVSSLQEIPFLTGGIIAGHSLVESQAFLRPGIKNGYIYSSSGTTGNPKFTFYSLEEFALVSRLLSRGYRARGLGNGDKVANLFVAGNMWSSFLAIEKALTALDVIQLPIGGTAEPELILYYLGAFSPRAVFGIPTQLVSLARLSREKNIPLHIPLLFYAGEHFNESARQYLTATWKTENFCSAGYASVDAGPVGYQCDCCEEKVHHLFARYIHLEIIGGEAVVTSLLRKAMPFIRLRTGDGAEWIEGPCRCGSPEPRFKLLGRCDNMANIWGCRLFYDDVEKALRQNNIDASLMQLRMTEQGEGEDFKELLTVMVESPAPGKDILPKLKESIYRCSSDLEDFHSLEWLADKIDIQFAAPGTIPRIKRTGKIRLFVDNR